MKALPEIPFLKEWLVYDQYTGVFTWAKSPHPRIKIGQTAGARKVDGYIHINIQKRSYSAHRIAWKLHYGVDPILQIDHINGIRSDNKISNLREASSAQNHQNRAIPNTNTSGYVGVYFDKKWNFWCARIRAKPKRIFLGCFKTAEEAHAAYAKAKAELHLFQPKVPQR